MGAAVDHVLSNMGYEELLREKSPEDWEDRIENVMELRSVVPEGDLAEALAEAALFTDADTQDPDDRRSVGLLTLHAAKGLEFPVVFPQSSRKTSRQQPRSPSSHRRPRPARSSQSRRRSPRFQPRSRPSPSRPSPAAVPTPPQRRPPATGSRSYPTFRFPIRPRCSRTRPRSWVERLKERQPT